MRGKQTVRDMVLSVAVIGVVVAGIYLFVPHSASGSGPVQTVSYRVELGQARRAAPYPVAGPVGLSPDWRATSVNYDGSNPKSADWHLGFLDPQNQYISIDQSNSEAASFVSTTTQQSHRVGTQNVAGTTWQRYGGGRYRALVRTTGGVTTMVDGTAPYDQLARLAGALRTS
jgi:Protein of unknown function (DUF4245)